MAAPASDPSPVSVPSRDLSSGGDVTAPASGPVHPSACDEFPSGSSDSALLAAVGSVTQPSHVAPVPPSGFNFLDRHGFLRREKIALRCSGPNPPGPPSSAEELENSVEQSADLSADESVDLFDGSAGLSNVSADLAATSADPSNVAADPPAVPGDPPDVSAVADPPADLSVDSPVPPLLLFSIILLLVYLIFGC